MSKTKEQISYNMGRIKSKDTKIEVILRNELWHRGLRYRKNVKGIIGKTDIAFIGKKLQFFVIVNFGTDMIGRIGKKILRLIKSFGYLK